MTEKLTEREEKLIEYINFLIGTLNIHTMTLAHMHRAFNWGEKLLNEWDVTSKQEEMIETLKNEFKLELSLVTDDDIIEESKK